MRALCVNTSCGTLFTPSPLTPPQGEWDMSNVAAFLQYIHDKSLFGPGSPLVSFELGNELIGHLDPVVNVMDIKALAQLIQKIWADVPEVCVCVHVAVLDLCASVCICARACVRACACVRFCINS